MKFVFKKEFTAITLNIEEEIYIILIANLVIADLHINFFQQALIQALMSTNIAITMVNSYSKFENV